jgi:hypothetical protein
VLLLQELPRHRLTVLFQQALELEPELPTEQVLQYFQFDL